MSNWMTGFHLSKHKEDKKPIYSHADYCKANRRARRGREAAPSPAQLRSNVEMRRIGQ